MGFPFDVEVFDHRGLRARAEGAERGVVDRRGGHDGAAAVVRVACFEDDGVLAVDEEVGHPAGVRRQQRDAERRGLEDDIGQAVIEGGDDDEVAGGVERKKVEAIAEGQCRHPERSEGSGWVGSAPTARHRDPPAQVPR